MSTTDSTSLDSPSLYGSERDSLVMFVDSEIKLLQEETARPGWTKWALYGGVATCCWLGLTELGQTPSPRSHPIYLVWLTLLFVLMGLSPVRYLSAKKRKADEVYGRVTGTREAMSPVLQFAKFARLSLFIFLLFVLSDLVPAAYFILSSTLVGFLAVLIVTLMILSFFLRDTPFPANQFHRIPSFHTSPGKALLVIVPLMSIASFVAAFGWFQALLQVTSTLPELKLSALGVGIYVLLTFLANLRSEPPLLGNLIQIRRQLALDQLPADAARSQIDLALHGLRLADFFVNAISRLLTYLQQFAAEMHSATKKIDAIERLVLEAAGQASEDHHVFVETMSESVAHDLETASTIMCDDVMPLARKIIGKSKATSMLSHSLSGVEPDLDWMAPHQESIDDALDKYDGLVHRWFGILLEHEGDDTAALMIERLNKTHEGVNFDPSTGRPAKGP